MSLSGVSVTHQHTRSEFGVWGSRKKIPRLTTIYDPKKVHLPRHLNDHPPFRTTSLRDHLQVWNTNAILLSTRTPIAITVNAIGFEVLVVSEKMPQLGRPLLLLQCSKGRLTTICSFSTQRRVGGLSQKQRHIRCIIYCLAFSSSNKSSNMGTHFLTDSIPLRINAAAPSKDVLANPPTRLLNEQRTFPGPDCFARIATVIVQE